MYALKIVYKTTSGNSPKWCLVTYNMFLYCLVLIWITFFRIIFKSFCEVYFNFLHDDYLAPTYLKQAWYSSILTVFNFRNLNKPSTGGIPLSRQRCWSPYSLKGLLITVSSGLCIIDRVRTKYRYKHNMCKFYIIPETVSTSLQRTLFF